MQRKARIERIIVGVVKHAFEAADCGEFTIVGAGTAVAYVAGLCQAAGGVPGGGLEVSAASKTALLLGIADRADLLPLGDLYQTQVAELTGETALPTGLVELAKACGGAETLDRVLQRHYDGRREWTEAAAALDDRARDLLWQRLEAARFQRGRVGIVPKIGGRTLGIDLNA
jgi:hypothetical protein